MKYIKNFSPINESLTKKSVRMKVVGKEIKPARFLSGKKYIIILRIEDPNIQGNKIVQREVGYEQYYQMEEGSFWSIYMYSADNKMWYFSAEEADQANW